LCVPFDVGLNQNVYANFQIIATHRFFKYNHFLCAK
jgi:hypothetical protein